MKTALAFVGLLAACAPSAPPSVQAGISIPDDVRYCPKPATVPVRMPKIVSTTGLRIGYENAEKARVRDHLAAVECKRALDALVSMVDAYNASPGSTSR